MISIFIVVLGLDLASSNYLFGPIKGGDWSFGTCCRYSTVRYDTHNLSWLKFIGNLREEKAERAECCAATRFNFWR